MNILVINGNTTQAITDRVAATARAVCASGTTINAVTAETGPRVIATRTENLLVPRPCFHWLRTTIRAVMPR